MRSRLRGDSRHEEVNLASEDVSKFNRRALLKWLAAGGAASAIPVGLAGITTESISVERHTLKLPQWDAHGMRVALLSDIHANTQEDVDLAIEAMRLAMAQKPDLIVLPGDFSNYGDDRRLGYIARSLEPLRDATCPVLATLGNHDYSGLNVKGVMDTVRKSGVDLLVNEYRDFQGVTIFGFDDGASPTNSLDGFLSGNYSTSLVTLMHEPDIVYRMPKTISLQLSGHSHGGQICLPGGYPLYTPHGAHDYYAGFYPHAPVPLFVTRGIGTVGPRLRLNCPPELSLLTLEKA